MINKEVTIIDIKEDTGKYGNPEDWKELKVLSDNGEVIEKVNHKSSKFEVQKGYKILINFVSKKNEYYSGSLISKIKIQENNNNNPLNFFNNKDKLEYSEETECYFIDYYTKKDNWKTSDKNTVKSTKTARAFKYSNDQNLIIKVTNYLDKIIKKNIVLCCVPSHSKGNNASTIVKVTKDLAKMDRIDGSSCLIRKNTIQQLKMKGSDRSKKVHFDSIEPNYIDIFKNKDVLLIDDVVTSGNSLDACSEILKKPFDIEEGAKSVVKFAIWKTIQ